MKINGEVQWLTMKKWIDGASYAVLLAKWRFAPVGDPMFQGEMGDYYAEVMKRKGEEIGNDRASRS